MRRKPTGFENFMPIQLTVDNYQEMIDNGLLPEGEPVELIDGQLVYKDRSAAGQAMMSVGNKHIWVVNKLGKLSRDLEPLGCHMQTQAPIALPPFNEPEPDGAILLGTEDDYLENKPGPKDVPCVIEVADSSLLYDRTTKQRIYADAGLPIYISSSTFPTPAWRCTRNRPKARADMGMWEHWREINPLRSLPKAGAN